MSVAINYKGRFGNHLFQYVVARIFSEDNDLKLITPFDCEDVVRMEPQIGGQEVTGPNITLTDSHDVFGRRWAPARYLLSGFFQNSQWLYEHRERILQFAKTTNCQEKNTKDLVMNVRLGDFKAMGWVIDPKWYLDVLEQEKFDRLHIVTDELDEAYFQPFAKFNPIFVSQGRIKDWDYLRSFDRVICSNSTFCWWAMFFDPPSTMYVFKRWVGLPGNSLSIPGSIELDGKFLREVGVHDTLIHHHPDDRKS